MMKKLSTTFCAAVFTVAVLAPYLTLLAVSLSKSWGLQFWQNLTLQHYRFVLFEYDVTRRAIANSLLLASAAAACMVDLRRHEKRAAKARSAQPVMLQYPALNGLE